MTRASIVVVAAMSASAPVVHVQAPAPAARVAAEEWAGLLDQGLAAETWQQAAAPFRDLSNPHRWAASVENMRRLLGPQQSRAFRWAEARHELPTGQRGEFVMLYFHSMFTLQVGTTIETIAVLQEPGGRWRVVWYDAK